MRQSDLENKQCLDDCLITRALSGLCVGLILTNASGRVVWLNRAAERVLGLSDYDCTGRPLNQLLKDLQLAAFWQEAAEAEGNMLADVVVQWPEELSLKANATRYVDGEGREIGRALLFCDVTAEKTVQVELSQEIASRLLDLTSTARVPKPVDNLTQQELRVLRLVGQGLSNERIAETIGVSPSTVRSHLKNLYRKLSIRSRSEAVAFAARNHLA